MSEITIPPLLLPDEPYTTAMLACYVSAAEAYLTGVSVCIATGEPPKLIQACINGHYVNYLIALNACDIA
jgi:hypothetical protein